MRRTEFSRRKRIGINIVRGGLFKDNGIGFSLGQEEELCHEVAARLSGKGAECIFFTNGSTLDSNALMDFKERFQVPDAECVFVDTTRQLVGVVSGCDAVLTFRMHASIIAWSYGIPCINFDWAPKIPELYMNMGHPERTIPPSEWNAETAVRKLLSALDEGLSPPSGAYLMSLYSELFHALKDLVPAEGVLEPYELATVKERLSSFEVPASEDVRDLSVKVCKGCVRYYSLFKKNRSLRQQLDEFRRSFCARAIRKARRLLHL